MVKKITKRRSTRTRTRTRYVKRRIIDKNKFIGSKILYHANGKKERSSSGLIR